MLKSNDYVLCPLILRNEMSLWPDVGLVRSVLQKLCVITSITALPTKIVKQRNTNMLI